MDDRAVDQRLRDVPAPSGLAARAAAAAFDDAALDRILCDVPPPVGLAARIAAAARADRGSPVPVATRRNRPTRRSPTRTIVTVARDLIAVAATLGAIWLVVAGGAHLSRTLATPSGRRTSTPLVARRSEASRTADPAGRSRPREEVVVASDAGGPPRQRVEPATAPPPRPDTLASGVDAVPEAGSPQVRGAAVGLGGGGAWTRTPMRTPRESWRQVPRTPGYDLLFEMTHGESPFIDPRHAGLRTHTPPLTVETSSFDRYREDGVRGPMPRTEHVLAAIPPPDADLPVAGAAVRLAMHAVRSLGSSTGRPTLLVEVAATAGGFPDRSTRRPPLAATIVLDRASGAAPHTWHWACRGLAAVAARMEADDRMSVVVAGPVPRLAIQGGTGPAVADLAAELERLEPSDGSDLDAALDVASSISTRATTAVIVAQEGVADTGGSDVRGALGRWQERSAGGDGAATAPAPGCCRFVLVDAGTDFEPSRPPISFGRTAANPLAIRRALLAAAFGDDTVVATRCRLTVDFDPGSVTAYRLVGHRQSAVESLSAGPPAAADLHVGETVRAVYEVVPRSATPVRATARFAWSSGSGGGDRELAAVLDGRAPDCSAVTPSPHGCELLLAVAFAEAATGSVHATPQARDAATALVTRWRARGDVTPLGAVFADAIPGAMPRASRSRAP